MATPHTDDIARLSRLALQEEAIRWKQTFTSREDEETLFKNIFDNIPVGVEIYNEAGILVDVNAEDLAIFGLQKKEDMLGIDLLHNPNIGPERTRIIMENDESRFHFDYDFALTRGYYKNNRTGTINLITKIRKLFHSDGQCIGYVMINIDNTANRERERELTIAKERAERADTLKSAFIANMSHEIRTPLNSIVGFSQVITEMVKDQPEVTEFAKIIQHDSEKLMKLIDGLLEVADIQSGNKQIEKEQVNIISFIDSMVDNMKQNMKEGVTLSFTSPYASLDMETDVNRLIQILMNLMQYCMKHTESGYIIVAVEKDPANTMALISVTDTGGEIPKQIRDVMFDRFEKREEFIHDTGMELTISQTIVESLGGRIWIDEDYNSGARFVFSHPLK